MSQTSQIVTAVAELTRALQTAGDVLARLAADASEVPVAHRAMQASAKDAVANPLDNLPARWSKVHSEWPQIGGRRFQRIPPDIFLGESYRRAFEPGRRRICYVGDCVGVQQLSQRFCVPIAKVSTCGDERLTDRLGEIGREPYGATIFFDGNEAVEDGFERWSVIRPPKGLIVSPNSPVEVTERALVARLPISMSTKQFDDRYDELVRLGSINDWLQTDAGLIHCQKVRADARYGSRYTRRGYDRGTQPEEAKEIVAFRCRSDFSRLVQIIEFVIAEHLGLIG